MWETNIHAPDDDVLQNAEIVEKNQIFSRQLHRWCGGEAGDSGGWYYRIADRSNCWYGWEASGSGGWIQLVDIPLVDVTG